LYYDIVSIRALMRTWLLISLVADIGPTALREGGLLGWLVAAEVSMGLKGNSLTILLAIFAVSTTIYNGKLITRLTGGG